MISPPVYLVPNLLDFTHLSGLYSCTILTKHVLESRHKKLASPLVLPRQVPLTLIEV